MGAELPSRFGRFEVRKLLGRGAMGTVYLAEDPVIGRQVAIKVLRTHVGAVDDEDTAEMVSRFQREFQSAGTLTHPNIVTVYDVGRHDERPFIAMEYVRGESLESELLSRREFTFEEVADLASQLAGALDYAHGRSIIHRDIKPANILMTWDGEVKITDFGVAKLASSTMTRTGTIIGTPAYMAPEQVTGAALTGAADQFSLAVIVYQMLTGERPFAGESPTAILYKIVHGTPQPPRELNQELPPGINQVLLRALSKNPAARFDSCTSFAQAVRSALGGTPAARAPQETVIVPAQSETMLLRGASETILERHQQHETGGRIFWLVVVGLAVVGLALGWRQLEKRESLPPPEPQVAGQAAAGAEEVAADGAGTEAAAPPAGEGAAAPALPLRPTDEEETLRIVSRPEGARVVLDGEDLEARTPAEIALAPGRSYELRLELEGYRAAGMTVDLDQLPGELRTKGELFFPLTPEVPPGFLRVASAYPVTLEVDGRRHGAARDLRLPVAPGSRRLVVRAAEVFLHRSLQVEIRSDEEFRVPVPPLVTVTLTAVPGNCQVSIDGRQVDFTPVRDLPVAAGLHELSFHWPGLGRTVIRRENLSPENRQINARPGE